MNESERLKKWRRDNPEKVKAYAKMRYKRDRDKIMKAQLERRRENGYKDCKTPQAMENTRIRRKTRYYYPLADNTCQFCNQPAKHRHHTTVPLQFDKFLFLCKKHHDEIHNKQ